MSFDYCRECRTVHGSGRHLPEWEVWNADEMYGETRDDSHTVRAADEEEAAERWAEEEDTSSCDYTIVSGEPGLVFVAKPGESPVRYSVQGESVPSYRAVRANGERMADDEGGKT